MDPFKRELYMRARTILEHRLESCVCLALAKALRELGMTKDMHAFNPGFSLEELIQDIFPEFFALDDLIKWGRDSDITYAVPRPEGSGSYWWHEYDLTPRLRILDCILNSH